MQQDYFDQRLEHPSAGRNIQHLSTYHRQNRLPSVKAYKVYRVSMHACKCMWGGSEKLQLFYTSCVWSPYGPQDVILCGVMCGVMVPAFPGSSRQVFCDVDVCLLENLGQSQNCFSVLKVLKSNENWTSAANLRT